MWFSGRMAELQRLPAHTGKRLFCVDQQALKRAVAPVLERGEGNRVCIAHQELHCLQHRSHPHFVTSKDNEPAKIDIRLCEEGQYPVGRLSWAIV